MESAWGYADILRHSGFSVIEEKVSVMRNLCTHSAIFAKVKVDEDLGTIEVSAVAAGRILNPEGNQQRHSRNFRAG